MQTLIVLPPCFIKSCFHQQMLMPCFISSVLDYPAGILLFLPYACEGKVYLQLLLQLQSYQQVLAKDASQGIHLVFTSRVPGFLEKLVFNNKQCHKKTRNKANFNATHDVTEKAFTKWLTNNKSVNLHFLHVLVLSSWQQFNSVIETRVTCNFSFSLKS